MGVRWDRAAGCLRSVGEELRPMSRPSGFSSSSVIGNTSTHWSKAGYEEKKALDDLTHIILHFSMPGVW